MSGINNTHFAKSLDVMAKNLSEMAGNHIPKAMSAAINKTMVAARQDVVVKTSKKERIPIPKIRKKILLRKSRPFGKFTKLNARISIYEVGTPLISLVTGKKGINFNSIKGQNKKTKRDGSALFGGTGIFGGNNAQGKKFGRFLQRAFINKVRSSGQTHILQRKGKSRNPIDVPKIDAYKTAIKLIGPAIKAKEQQEYSKALEHEFDVRMKKIVK